MKKSLFILLMICFHCLYISAQNIAINANGAAPDISAMLDVQSTSKGMLIPRMTTAQRMAIASAATGLMVFDNTTNSFWFKSKTQWVELISSANDVWVKQNTNVYLRNNNNVGIGTNNPQVKLQVDNGGDVTATGGGYIQLGSSSNPNLALDKNELQARNSSAASDFYMQVNGGNVGIGTGNADVKLQVDNGTDADSTGGGFMQLGADNISNLAFDNNEIQARNNHATSKLYLQNSGGDIQIGSSSSAANLNIVNGKLTQPGTGSFNLVPLCYGSIAYDGHIYSATPNVSVSKTARGVYIIKCPGISASTIAVVTLNGPLAEDNTVQSAYITSPSKAIDVLIYSNLLSSNIDNNFSFVLYNP